MFGVEGERMNEDFHMEQISKALDRIQMEMQGVRSGMDRITRQLEQFEKRFTEGMVAVSVRVEDIGKQIAHGHTWMGIIAVWGTALIAGAVGILLKYR
jgi:hypothetical protein